MNSTNSSQAMATSSSFAHQNYHHHHHNYQQHQGNGVQELNYINAEYMKDRNVSKKSSSSNTVKFNQRNGGVSGTSSTSSLIRELNAKNRRNAKNYNPDNKKKSYSPYRRDKNVDYNDGGGSGRGRNSRSSDGGANSDRKTGSSTKSEFSYMPWHADNQRLSKRQTTTHQNIKHGINNKNYDMKGSDGHKTNANDNNINDVNMNSAMKIKTMGTDTVHRERIAPQPPPAAASAAITTSATMAIDPIINVHNSNNGGASKQHSNNNNGPMNGRALTNANNEYINSLPSVAYLQAATVESKSSLENSATINNHNSNNNNVFVDTYEAAPTAMELECVAGYDGGLPQYFILEAYDSRTRKLRLNITSVFNELPLFRIDLAGE